MMLSRTMRPEDYKELEFECNYLNHTLALCGPVPYMHRMWEYALILRAYWQVFGPRPDRLEVADFGCSDGLSPSILLREGHNVSLYDIWDQRYGDKLPDAVDKANKASSVGRSSYRIIKVPLGGLLEEDKYRYDIALCISVMEHIPDEEAAFNDLLDSVKEHGLVLVTMDFHPSGVDNLYYHWLRSRIYNQPMMESLVSRAEQKGFKLLGDGADWSWRPDMVMVESQYGFSSLVLTR